jgi:hypothetical protein
MWQLEGSENVYCISNSKHHSDTNKNCNTNQLPSVSLYMSAINAVDKSASGLPLRPPFSAACLSDRFGIRLIVVLEITSPST